eukprot:SAG31_NODE_980_length_10594_cov_7.565889_2_plen_101_part_00
MLQTYACAYMYTARYMYEHMYQELYSCRAPLDRNLQTLSSEAHSLCRVGTDVVQRIAPTRHTLRSTLHMEKCHGHPRMFVLSCAMPPWCRVLPSVGPEFE